MSGNADEQEHETNPSHATSEELVTKYTRDKDLRQLNLTDGIYTDINISLTGARLDGVEMFRATLNGLNLNNATLVGANAERVVCIGTTFKGADLRTANLTGADLSRADLRDADLRGCWTAGANLTGSKVCGMKIDRRALRALGGAHGGLTDADLAALEVEDDQVKLTTSFGGFWTVLHLLAVTIFFLPYLVFGVGRYIAAELSPCAAVDPCVTLREALWDYIITGGKGDEVNILAISIFILLLFYNVFRMSLVYKARSLELAERASGMPRQFVLSGYWKLAYYGCQVLVWVNFLLVLVHAYKLLDMKVPPVV